MRPLASTSWPPTRATHRDKTISGSTTETALVVFRRTTARLRASSSSLQTRATPGLRTISGSCTQTVGVFSRTMSPHICGSTWPLREDFRETLTSRELVAAKMTPEQIAEAKKRFAEWLGTPGLEKRAALPASQQPTESAHPKPIVIADDNGGGLRDYLERYRRQVAAGATFRIDGRCRSACTLVLAWADRVCITERAALGFHQTRDKSGQRSQSGSDLLMSLYPAPVREYISAHGGLPPPWGTMWVSGPALRGLVKPCE